ncbi:MAG: hypothetical protein JXB25_04335 [Deltaproteobacteria bacterium]|nr:hypothetical protein [Deltaproteobacteria bacterium]
MSALKIIHITPTPLVGAPGKIAWAQRMKGHNALAVALSDYPQKGPLANKFLDKILLLNDFTTAYIEEYISTANVIHIHNYFPNNKLSWITRLNQSALFVYQVHSPLREGPLYVDRGSYDSLINFRVRLVVGQYLGRLYPSYLPVPNLILSPPSVTLREPGERLKVMFSPTHSHVGRWTSKNSNVLNDVLESLKSLGKIEIIKPQSFISPETLFEVRRGCHVTIDEITTGGFHQVSLEGLCAGNIVINRADYFAKTTFGNFCDGVPPPFTYADESTIGSAIECLAENYEDSNRLQKFNYDYFQKYCDPIRLVEVFDAAYQRAL